jgi:hypothetical protein
MPGAGALVVGVEAFGIGALVYGGLGMTAL